MNPPGTMWLRFLPCQPQFLLSVIAFQVQDPAAESGFLVGERVAGTSQSCFLTGQFTYSLNQPGPPKDDLIPGQ